MAVNALNQKCGQPVAGVQNHRRRGLVHRHLDEFRRPAGNERHRVVRKLRQAQRRVVYTCALEKLEDNFGFGLPGKCERKCQGQGELFHAGAPLVKGI